jgi:hypothetical protein
MPGGAGVWYREFGDSHRRQIRYGAMAMAALLLTVALVAFSRSDQSADAESTAQAQTAAAAPAAQSTPSSDDITPTLSLQQRDEAVGLIGEARRQATAGNFAAAEASLQQARKAAPGLPEIEQARADIDRMRTPEGSLAVQLQRARLAIEHDDATAAEAALAEASRVKPDAPEIAPMRAAIQQLQEKAARREARIAEALVRMREAMSRRDFAAADSALNEAERIDIQNPSIRRARGELARARGAQAND